MILNLSKIIFGLLLLILFGCASAKRNTNALKHETKKEIQSPGLENVLLSIQNFSVNGKAYETTCNIELDEAIGNILPMNQYETEDFKATFHFSFLDSKNKELEKREVKVEVMEGNLNTDVNVEEIPQNAHRCILIFETLVL